MRRRSLVAGALALLLAASGCTPARESQRWSPSEALPRAPDALARTFGREVGVDLRPGNAVELVHNGQVFDVMVEEIHRARHSVHLLFFIWRPGEPSDRVVQALAERTRAGVACRVLVEKIGSRDFRAQVWPQLERAGCQVRFYRKINDVERSGELVERNHQKLAVFDGRVGLTGGWGVHTSWMGDTRSRDEWRDDAVRVEGPAATGMQQAFARSWRHSGGDPLGPLAYAPAPDAGPARAGFVDGTSRNRAALRMSHLLIRSARERLWIANSYFVPSEELLQALVDKAREGVDVRVLVPGTLHDVKPVLAAQRSTYARLLAAGVRLYEYGASMMHAKTMLVDDSVAVVGSINLDPMSLEQTKDGALVAVSPELARQLERALETDFAASHPVLDARPSAFQELARRVFWFLGRTL